MHRLPDIGYAARHAKFVLPAVPVLYSHYCQLLRKPYIYRLSVIDHYIILKLCLRNRSRFTFNPSVFGNILGSSTVLKNYLVDS